MPVFEAEFREVKKDIQTYNDHDARVALWFGRDLPGSLEFSQLSWSKARFIVIVNRGPSCPVDVFVMVGPQYAADNADGWASWNVLTNNHAMPIVPVGHR